MSDGRKRWTVHLVRADGQRSRTLSASRPGMLAGAFLLVGLLLLAGYFVGSEWAARAEGARVARMTDELQTLREESRRIGELSLRLQAIERDYARLQSVVTEGVQGEAPPALELPIEPDGAPAVRAGTAPSAPAWPLAQRGFITRTFGSRGDDGREGHPGLDIAVPSGSYVRTMAAGIVGEAGEDEVYGSHVRIAHGDGLSSLYGHNSWLFVQPGDTVQRLQVIALSGNTGRSTAPHLHFEITRDGILLDPLAFVNQGVGVAGAGSGEAGVEQR